MTVLSPFRNLHLRSKCGPIARCLHWVTILLVLNVPFSAADQPVTVDGSLDAVIPADLRSLLVDNPYVLFEVDVGDDGTLFDVMARESNHRDLIPAATKVLLGVTFNPAVEDGKAIRTRTSVFVRFFDPEQRAWQMGGKALPFGARYLVS